MEICATKREYANPKGQQSEQILNSRIPLGNSCKQNRHTNVPAGDIMVISNGHISQYKKEIGLFLSLAPSPQFGWPHKTKTNRALRFRRKKKKTRNFDFALSLRRKSKVLTHRFPDFGGGERGTGIFHFKPPISYSILRLLESLARNPYSSTSKIRFCGFLNFLRFLGSSESLGSSLLQWERRNSSILESIATWRIAIFLISCHSPVIDANR